ncbi:MAG: diguanylate cyclase [Elusimicrobiota bacterium]|nr:diguanylate cyclase [Endomicrobiia bacterium]MDW8165822.1 diguanylate cyclase [Elusimicrobiota bacterium]
MKDFLFFLLKVTIYLIIGLSVWWIIKTPEYVTIIYIIFLIALLLAYLTNDREIQIFVVLSSIFISGSIVLLHNFQPKYDVLIDKIVIVVETLFIIGVFLFLQKKSWSVDVYSTTFIEQIENLEKEISRISDEIRDLQTKIYNINEIKNNFKIMQEVITTLGSVSSISVIKNYVVNLIHKLLPGVYIGLYLTYEEVPKNTLEEEIVKYIKANNKYFFSNDVIYLLQKFKTSYLYPALSEIKSILGFPIKIYSSSEIEDTGYLIFISPNEVNEDTLRLLSIFSSYVGITISNIKLIEHTQNLAITDTLTGLYVHKYFKELLEEEINRAKYYNRIFSLAMFDIDNFKHINDTYGHNVGDIVLIKFSEILRKRLREVDKIFRYGGDEFAIIFPDTNISNAEKICEEIRNIVLNETIVAPTTSLNNVSSLSRIKFTISGGVMEYSNEYSLESFVNSVDKLLYKSKTTGKNKITCQKK